MQSPWNPDSSLPVRPRNLTSVHLFTLPSCPKLFSFPDNTSLKREWTTIAEEHTNENNQNNVKQNSHDNNKIPTGDTLTHSLEPTPLFPRPSLVGHDSNRPWTHNHSDQILFHLSSGKTTATENGLLWSGGHRLPTASPSIRPRPSSSSSSSPYESCEDLNSAVEGKCAMYKRAYKPPCPTSSQVHARPLNSCHVLTLPGSSLSARRRETAYEGLTLFFVPFLCWDAEREIATGTVAWFFFFLPSFCQEALTDCLFVWCSFSCGYTTAALPPNSVS